MNELKPERLKLLVIALFTVWTLLSGFALRVLSFSGVMQSHPPVRDLVSIIQTFSFIIITFLHSLCYKGKLVSAVRIAAVALMAGLSAFLVYSHWADWMALFNLG